MRAQDYYSLGTSCFQRYELQCAKQNLEKYIEQYPQDVKAMEYLGDIAVDQKDWETALGYFKSLVDLFPNNANYHFKYGGAMGLKALNISKIRALFLIDNIKEHFLKAAQLDKNHIEVRWALVELYINLPTIVGGGKVKASRYAEALYQLSKVDGLMAKGYIALMEEESLEAASCYKASLKEGIALHDYTQTEGLQDLKVTASRYGWDRNQLHYQLGKAAFQYDMALDKGLAHLEHFVRNYGVQDHITKDWGYYYMAKIYKRKNNLKNALLSIDQALKLRPDFKEALRFKKEL